MASNEIVEAFTQRAKAVLEWKPKKDTLIHRPKWGDSNFEQSEPLIDRILNMTEQFSTLPVELVLDDVLNELSEQLSGVVNIFNQIDRFSTAEMVSHQGEIATQIRGRHDLIVEFYRAEVPWLAIFSGKMEHWLSGARDEYNRTKEMREKVEEEREAAAQAAQVAREHAGAAGAAEFTAAFRNQAKAAKVASIRWLWATGITFALATAATLTFIVLHALQIPPLPSDAVGAIVYFGERIGTVGLLFFASMWCGRHYRAYRHNYEVSQHREACLENMQAFSRAVEDQAVKDMVVLEFSRAASQAMPTGFISGRAEVRADPLPQVWPLTTGQVSSP